MRNDTAFVDSGGHGHVVRGRSLQAVVVLWLALSPHPKAVLTWIGFVDKR